jgi:transposase InsO family protein
MNWKGIVQAFACAESFFKTLKGEVDNLEGRHTKKQVKTEVFEYMEIYYNKRHRHSILGYAILIALTNLNGA